MDERPKAQIAIHNISGKPITSNRPIVGSIKLFLVSLSFELMPDSRKFVTPENVLTQF